MGEFFGSLYSSIFEEFYGLDLANYLWGTTSDTATNQYIRIGLGMLGISFVVAIVFYYIVNHPKLNNWWGWLIFAGINCVGNFIMGWQYVQRDLDANLMTKIDPETGQTVALDVTTSNCLCFGVTNAIISLLFFFIFSMIIKWRSKNVSHAPF